MMERWKRTIYYLPGRLSGTAAGRQKCDPLRYCPDGGVNLITRRQRLLPSRQFLNFEFVRPSIQLLRGPEANDYNTRVCRDEQSKAS